MSRAVLRSAARARPGVDAASRLPVLEQLLATDDVGRCAQHALEWLTRRGAGATLCLEAATDGSGELVAVARVGVPGAAVPRLTVEMEAVRRALAARGPVFVAPNGGASTRWPPPFGREPFWAVPLPGGGGMHAAEPALLLVTSLDGRRRAELAWLASVLGPRLAELRALRRREEGERRRRREQALLHNVINAVTDPIILTDPEGRIIFANARAESLLAAQEGQSEGRRRAVALNNMLFSAALSRAALDDGEPWRHELLLVDPSEGSDLLFELLSTVVSDPREGTGIVSVLRNVTDLRRATEELETNYRRLRVAEATARAERDRLDLIIDSVADPILVTDPSGNIVMMNTPAERLFTVGPGADEDAQRVVQANDASFSSLVASLFLAGEAMRRSGRLTLTDPRTGAGVPVEAISGKIVSEQGELTAFVTILHDRTEELERAHLYEQLKRASAELEQKVREATAELVRQNELLRRQHIQLEQASALKSQFLANMSHEFRTPLNAILGYTSMLQDGVSGELTPAQRRSLGRIESNGQHLLAIINDILDITRIEAGKMPLTFGEFAMADVIAEVFAEVEPLIVGSRLTVTSAVAPALPPVQSDRQKLKQIVINLLSNALKFTPAGSVSVHTRYVPEPDEVAVDVEDTGIGIAPSDQERIFEDFRQADNSPTREYGGAGLGLAICRRLAGMLGGRLELRSAPGKGSTFTLVVPRTRSLP